MGYGARSEVSLIYDTRAPIFSNKSVKLGADNALVSNFMIIISSEQNHNVHFHSTMFWVIIFYGLLVLLSSLQSKIRTTT